MYTPDHRDRIRQSIIEAALQDSRITGGAVTGSTARGEEDAWSDIDLAFGVRRGVDIREVLGDFSLLMRRQHHAVDELDVPYGSWIYRVFLLPNTLQVDIAVAPESDFGARAPSFKLLFGEAATLQQTPSPQAETLIAWAWLYALDVRSSVARNKLWQAEHMIAGMRNQVLSLACLRHNLPTNEGRGIDRLPEAVKTPFEHTLVRSLDLAELSRAFQETTARLLDEINHANTEMTATLQSVLLELANSEGSSEYHSRPL